jgi:cold shock CspA family protein/ribosome-associated translation inhibitor RaiA
MPIPLRLTFRGIDRSDAIESVIRQRATQLERFSEQVKDCHVTIDMPHEHRRRGNQYAVQIVLQTLSGEVEVAIDPSLDQSPRNFQSVVSDAFDAAARQLEDNTQGNSNDTNGLDRSLPTGRVTKLLLGDRYGFITTPAGLEVYFHESSVVGRAFADLSVGSEVHFTLAPRDGDPVVRATSVQPCFT